MCTYKTNFLLVLFLIASIIGHSQDYFGAQIGLNRSQTPLYLTNDSEDIFIKSNILQKFSIALAFEKKVSDLTSILLEPTYTTEGALIEKKMTLAGNTFFSENSISYLRLPVLFKLNLKFRTTMVYGVGGVSFAFSPGGKNYNWTPFEGTTVLDIDFEKEGLDKIDYGATLGMGIEKEVAKGMKMSAGLRYYLGLNNISKQVDDEIYNQGIAVMMGMFYPLNKQ